MSKDTLELSPDQKALCVWLIEVWDDKQLGAFPYTFGFIAKSLQDFQRAGVPMALIRESVKIAIDTDKVANEEKWLYACGIAWKKFRNQRPLRDLVEEWKQELGNEDQP